MRFGFTASYVALWVLVVFQTLVTIGLLRQIVKLRRIVWAAGLSGEQGLLPGSLRPEFSARDLRSGRRLGSELVDNRTGVILFLSPDCSLCRGLADSLRPLGRDKLVPIFAVCDGEEEDCRIFLKRLGSDVPVLLDRDREIRMLYRVSSFPTAVVVDADRRVRGYCHPKDSQDLREMLTHVLNSSSFEVQDAEVEEGPNPLGDFV